MPQDLALPDLFLDGERLFSAHQNIDRDEGGDEARTGAHCERPARAEAVGDPADDGSADSHSAERNADPEGHDPAAHGWFSGKLHDAVGAVGQGEESRTADRERGGEPPVSGRDRGQSTAESEDAGSDGERREAWLLSAGGKQGAGERARGHDGGEQAESARVGVEDVDGHGGDEDGKVETKGADEKQHDEDRPEVGSTPHVAEPLQKSGVGAMRSDGCTEFGKAEERHREENRHEREPVEKKGPADPDLSHDQAGDGGANHLRGVERG